MADADLTQYNRTAVAAEAANAADALTSQLLVITDNKLITGELNGANQAPVNRALKRLGDMIAGVRGALLGNVVGINRRTLRSLDVDASGGAVSSIPDGTIRASGSHASSATAPTTSVSPGVIYQDMVCSGWCRGYWDGAAMVMVRGANVRSLTRNTQGDYTVVFNSVMTAPAQAEAQLTLGVNPSVVDHGFIGNIYSIADDGGGRVSVSFYTIDPNATGTKLDTSAISHFNLRVTSY